MSRSTPLRLLLPALTLLAAVGPRPAPAAEPQRREVGQVVLEDVPEVPAALRQRMNQYLNIRAAAFLDFADDGQSILISTRFGNTAQLHVVSQPMGARKQITFTAEPIRGGAFLPGSAGRKVVYLSDVGGNENAQIYLLNLDDGATTLLTDGVSRHEYLAVARNGKALAFSGTGRNKKDGDIYVAVAPDFKPRRVWEVSGAFYPMSFSPDASQLCVQEFVSEKESRLHLLDLPSGNISPIGKEGEKFAYSGGVFSADGKSLYFMTDRAGRFQSLYRRDLASARDVCLTANLPWDIETVVASPAGDRVAFSANEDGQSRVYLMKPDAAPGAYEPVTALPMGVVGGLEFSTDGKKLAMTLSTPACAGDTFVYSPADGRLTRWTESEIGGLNPDKLTAPVRIAYPTFDQTDGKPREIPAYYYRPAGDGPFPVVISIHGGPEGQERPGFVPTYQYWVNELKIAVLAPNVRGSVGYGRDYHMLDDGFAREDSVKDIGALLDWIGKQKELDPKRVAVFGGSYGGYMVLASLTNYPDRIKAGVDIVGICNFISFLEITAPYRQHLRRAEYGDERDPKMREHLKKISPLTNADKITSALYVMHGKNDPRVPVGEAQQIVENLRKRGKPVWYFLAKDEGHGFAKKENRDLYVLTATMFLEEQLKK